MSPVTFRGKLAENLLEAMEILGILLFIFQKLPFKSDVIYEHPLNKHEEKKSSKSLQHYQTTRIQKWLIKLMKLS